MRKGLSIFLVVLLVIGSVFTSYIVALKVAKKNNSASDSTTVTQMPVDEGVGDMVLLVEDNEKDYHFYKSGEKVVMIHNEKEYVFENWSENITLQTPVLSIMDIDEDDEDEVLIQVVEDVVENGAYNYGVYVLNRVTMTDGEETYKVNAITPGVAGDLMTEKVMIQVTQDPNCPKNGIVAMATAGSSINYDRETGIPDSYYYMFKCLQDSNGEYLTVNGWERGRFNCTISEDGGVLVQVPVIMSYEETSIKQSVGSIQFVVSVDSNCNNDIKPKSMKFYALDEYDNYSYRDEDDSWTSVVSNSSTTIPSDKTIDYIQYKFDFTGNLDTKDFSAEGDLNCISTVTATESYVELTAKSGCSFSESAINNLQYSLMRYRKTATRERNCDISYTASVTKNSSGNEVLRINYDKEYNQYTMDALTINFGVK